jgi:hypothetical protein
MKLIDKYYNIQAIIIHNFFKKFLFYFSSFYIDLFYTINIINYVFVLLNLSVNLVDRYILVKIQMSHRRMTTF